MEKLTFSSPFSRMISSYVSVLASETTKIHGKKRKSMNDHKILIQAVTL